MIPKVFVFLCFVVYNFFPLLVMHR